ncbi:hypothetical protein IW261DRAFT_1522857 [Armillaria novae-zelandiae]|uniref:Uncharacterized protein n=1 Tax=Armillaria novae-zelandiae TaxID=153914 RepID=A0AA39TX09_9AGAR|nr:hypothetical protein IW261DRAFT_1522857 [Armillaria novae-zelandiae]
MTRCPACAGVQDCLGPWMTRYAGRQRDGGIRIERWLSYSLGNEVCAVTSYSVTEQHGPGGRSRREKRCTLVQSIGRAALPLCRHRMERQSWWSRKSLRRGWVGGSSSTKLYRCSPLLVMENWGEGLLRYGFAIMVFRSWDLRRLNSISSPGRRSHGICLCGAFRFDPNHRYESLCHPLAPLVGQHQRCSYHVPRSRFMERPAQQCNSFVDHILNLVNWYLLSIHKLMATPRRLYRQVSPPLCSSAAAQ